MPTLALCLQVIPDIRKKANINYKFSFIIGKGKIITKLTVFIGK